MYCIIFVFLIREVNNKSGDIHVFLKRRPCARLRTHRCFLVWLQFFARVPLALVVNNTVRKKNLPNFLHMIF